MKVRLHSILGIPLLMLILPVLAAAQVTFVQQSFSAPSGSVPSVQVAFTLMQTAGNLNIIVVGWTDSTTAPTGVTDTANNTYKLAMGTAQIGSLSQAIYYAANINAFASNTVTVTFSGSTNQPDIRILEYKNADQNVPFDVSSWNTGKQVDAVTSTGNGSGSSAPSTNFANELFLGAALPQGKVGPGGGFKVESGDLTGDIVEDMNVTTAGIPAVATATSTSTTGDWVMEMLAIIQSGQGAVPGAAPTITSVTPGTAKSGVHVDVFIHGTNFRQGINAIFDTTPGVDCSLDPTGTIIDCFAPPHAAGTAKLVVQNLDGTESAPVDFTFSAAAAADFSMSSTGAQTVTAGSSATYTITITPANGFSSAVNLTCTPPANVKITCTLSPSSVTPGSASVTSTLTVTSTA
ncbi:MAG TPA: IPT/TIG domain-containing protein, partial [Terriglobales bacterium]|nr:IPT/TIG domain-containing protein [Terriglobales bacterium]